MRLYVDRGWSVKRRLCVDVAEVLQRRLEGKRRRMLRNNYIGQSCLGKRAFEVNLSSLLSSRHRHLLLFYKNFTICRFLVKIASQDAQLRLSVI